MARHDVVIIKDTHRGLLYEDGILKEVLPAGRHLIARPATSWASKLGLGRSIPASEVVLVDIRKADRTVLVPEMLTADRATISASFVVQFRISDPRAATHEVRNSGERLYGEVQTAARRLLRGLTLDEIMAGRDEIGEELLMVVADSAAEYGIEVSCLDLKDLTLPDELLESMNQAVFAKHLRRAQPIEAWGDEDLAPDSDEGGTEPLVAASRHDDPTLIFPRAHDVSDNHPSARDGHEAVGRLFRAASE